MLRSGVSSREVAETLGLRESTVGMWVTRFAIPRPAGYIGAANRIIEQTGATLPEIQARWEAGEHHCGRHGWYAVGTCPDCSRERARRRLGVPLDAPIATKKEIGEKMRAARRRRGNQ